MHMHATTQAHNGERWWYRLLLVRWLKPCAPARRKLHDARPLVTQRLELRLVPLAGDAVLEHRHNVADGRGAGAALQHTHQLGLPSGNLGKESVVASLRCGIRIGGAVVLVLLLVVLVVPRGSLRVCCCHGLRSLQLQAAIVLGGGGAGWWLWRVVLRHNSRHHLRAAAGEGVTAGESMVTCAVHVRIKKGSST